MTRLALAGILSRVAPQLGAAVATEYAGLLTGPMREAGITTRPRVAGFLAQLGVESGRFRYVEEIWGPTPAQLRYEGRLDLGNTQPGDGRRYAGHGWIQLTGRHNHRKVGQALGLDLEGQPKLATLPVNAARIACHFWATRTYQNRARPELRGRTLNQLADLEAVTAITEVINGGRNGLQERLELWRQLMAFIPEGWTLDAPEPTPGPDVDVRPRVRLDVGAGWVDVSGQRHVASGGGYELIVNDTEPGLVSVRLQAVDQ